MYIFIRKNKEKFILLFFVILFFLGIAIFRDYGISIDEDNSRINGFVSLKYIFEIFLPDKIFLINEIINVPHIDMHIEKGIGIIFDLPLALLELTLGVDDSRQYYLIRHFFNFLFFLASIYFFYKIANNRYNSTLIGILAASFLLLSPRIFAESFYNNKDLIFMSLFIINLYYSIKFLEKPTLKNILLFSITSSLAVDIRIFGIILPFLVIFIYFIKFLRHEEKKKNFVINFILLILLISIFILIFWPYLWNDPVNKFFTIFKSFSYYDIGIYNFYLGNHISAETIPWHYPLVWQAITIPPFYIILFSIGFFLVLIRLIKRLFQIEENNSFKDLWRGKNELKDLLFFLSFVIPLFIVINFNSTLYDGWRHLYFIYPCFIMISMCGYKFIERIFFKRNDKILLIVTLFFMLSTLYWMLKNHPYQNVYFNILAGKNFNKKYEMDYWGLANHNALKFIAENENREIKVAIVGTTDLFLSRAFLIKDLRKKITIIDNYKNADYIINPYRDWSGKSKNYNKILSDDFDIFYEIKIDKIPINTVYKKKIEN